MNKLNKMKHLHIYVYYYFILHKNTIIIFNCLYLIVFILLIK